MPRMKNLTSCCPIFYFLQNFKNQLGLNLVLSLREHIILSSYYSVLSYFRLTKKRIKGSDRLCKVIELSSEYAVLSKTYLGFI